MGWSLDHPVLCPVIVGRDDALGALARQLDRARAGAGQTVLLAGEAGIGKSRLVAEAKTFASRLGYLILSGQCFEPDRTLPYAPLLDLLRTYLSSRPAEALAAEVGGAAGSIVRLLPELGDRLPGAGLPTGLDPEQEKRRLFNDLTAFVVGLAATAPVLLVVEDVHWSDETSLEYLLGCARRTERQPVLILLTYRENEVSPALAYLLAELDRGRLATELALARLSGAEVEAMVRATFALARPVRADFRDLLVGLTDGNPFFVEEVLKSLVAAGDIFRSGDGWLRSEIGELRAPRSVQDAVRRRVERLSEAARRALRLAAVAGRRFDFALLQDLLQIDELALLSLMKELVAAQLVVEETADRFAFRHALTRQAIADDLLGRERKLLHRRVAEAMDRVYADATDRHFGDLAYHYAAAGTWPKVIDYGALAGKQALAMQSPRAAVQHLTRAIDAAAALCLPPAVELHRARGQAYEILGEFERAHADFEAALATAATTGNREAEWQAHVDLGFLWAARDYAATGDYYDRALALARATGDPVLVARSLNRVGNWRLNAGWPAEARRDHEEALAAFEGVGDRRGVTETLELLAMTAVLGDSALARSLYERVIPLIRELDDRRGLVTGLTVKALLHGNDYMYWVEVAEVAAAPDSARLCQEAVEIARVIGWPAGEANSLANLAGVLGTAGEYARALAAARAGLALADEIGHRQWSALAHLFLGELYADLFVLPPARLHLEQALTLAHGVQSAWFRENAAVALARTDLARGEVAGAEALLDEHFGAGRHPLPATNRLARKARAEVALARGEPAATLAIVDQLVAELAESAATIVIPTLERVRGEALLALGRPEAAHRVLQAATLAARERGMRPLLWRLHALLGRVHRATARAADAEREYAAARSLVEALAADLPDDSVPELGGASLGDHFRDAVAGLVPGLRPRTARQAAKQAYGGLTAREREIAAMIAGGRSNREIGAALFISERTVTTHISNILAKLGYATRAQVAAWAVEAGLARPDPSDGGA